jgi:hypothetical protein
MKSQCKTTQHQVHTDGKRKLSSGILRVVKLWDYAMLDV